MEYALGADLNNYFRWIQFAEAFPDETIVATVWRQLTGSHFRELLPLKQPLQREFYANRWRTEDWSVRTLSERIGHFTLRICTPHFDDLQDIIGWDHPENRYKHC